MEALVVAAGYGSRLSAVSPSKPLTPVAGVPLIGRVLDAARAGGASGFVVVTGHRADAVEAYLRGSHPDARCVRAVDWSVANGHSVLAGAAAIGRAPHLLMMADHLFDAAIVAELIAAPPAALHLAVDRRLANPLVDPADVTRVLTEGDAIRAIGKHLDRFDAYDCGLFRINGAFHDALRDAISDGSAGSISSGVARLARAGDARALTIGERWWIDVDDPVALGHAEAEVRGIPVVAQPLH